MFANDRAAGRKYAIDQYEVIQSKYRRASMLIGIYLPTQMDAVHSITVAYNPAMALRQNALPASQNGLPMPDGFRESLGAVTSAVIQAGQNGLNNLTNSARDHAHSPHIVRWPRLPWKRRN